MMRKGVKCAENLGEAAGRNKLNIMLVMFVVH